MIVSSDCDLTDGEKQRVVRYLRKNADWSKVALRNLGRSRYVAELNQQIRREIAGLEFVANWIEGTLEAKEP